MPDNEAIFAAIDAANSLDPVQIEVAGQLRPANLVYGERMSEELARFAPAASQALQIAARGQHIERWIIPRQTYPMDRPGYLRWRRDLKDHHGRRLAGMMEPLGFDAPTVTRVSEIVRKLRPAQDAEVQCLEDVVCIVFLKHEIEAFVAKHRHDRPKLARIIARTWRKMSPEGHEAAGALPVSAEVLALLEQGLHEDGGNAA